MKRKDMMKEAQKLCDRGAGACIYAEYNYSNGSEVIIGGEIVCMIHLMANIAQRISEKTGAKFEDIIEDMKYLRSKKKAHTVADGQVVDSEGPVAVVRQQVESEAEKRYAHKLKAAEDLIIRKDEEIAALSAQLNSMREKVESVRKAGDQNMLEASREIRKKESEIRKLRKDLEAYHEP